MIFDFGVGLIGEEGFRTKKRFILFPGEFLSFFEQNFRA